MQGTTSLIIARSFRFSHPSNGDELWHERLALVGNEVVVQNKQVVHYGDIWSGANTT